MNDLLKQRIKEFDIPAAAMSRYPLWDKVIVWQLDLKEEKTSGGLYIPEVAKERVSHRGVLLSAGLAALDRLYSYGVEPGHIVFFGRYAGQDEMVARRQAGTADDIRICVLSAAELNESEDLATALRDGSMSIKREDGEHFIDDATDRQRARVDLKEVA